MAFASGLVLWQELNLRFRCSGTERVTTSSCIYTKVMPMYGVCGNIRTLLISLDRLIVEVIYKWQTFLDIFIFPLYSYSFDKI